MHAISTEYSFRVVTSADLPVLRRWLETPAVARWWPDAQEQHDCIEGDLADAGMAMLIVGWRGRDFAYSQHSGIHGWGAAFSRGLPYDTRAMDSFIGEPDMLGLGHGAGFLRVMAIDLSRRYSMVTVDPDAANLRAQRAYERAGFRGDRIVATPAGSARLMFFEG